MCENPVTVLTESLERDYLCSRCANTQEPQKAFNYDGCTSVLTTDTTLHQRCEANDVHVEYEHASTSRGACKAAKRTVVLK